jgi:hypothetical protein
VEVEADEVAASLRFAPVTLDQRDKRTAPAEGDDAHQDPASSPPSSPSSRALDEVPF